MTTCGITRPLSCALALLSALVLVGVMPALDSKDAPPVLTIPTG